MDTNILKQKILELAIKGKLVPQDPNDEPASVLLERIREQKKQMVKEGKLKKKDVINDFTIFQGEDNLYYEKKADGSVKCIEDEIPFEIPYNWTVTHLESITKSVSSKQYHISASDFKQTGKYPVVSQSNEFIIGYNDDETKLYCHENPVIIFGDHTTEVKYVDFNFIVGADGVKIFEPIEDVVNGKFLKYVLEYYSIGLEKAGDYSRHYKYIKDKAFPIPPLNEQYRIVSTVQKIFDEINNISTNKLELDNLFNKTKSKILDLAIKGKLVPQDPNDEPASILLEQIRKEKEQLIKEGKIKRDKHKSIIFRRNNSYYEKLGSKIVCIDDEIPFEIPDSWEWCRLKQIVYNHSQIVPSDDFCYIDIGSINNKNQQLNINEKIICAKEAPSRARKIVKYGDILYATVRPYLHNMCIVNKKFSHIPIASTGFAVLACHADMYNLYLFYYLMSPIFDAYANDIENCKGMAYPAINDTRLYNALIPIPPLNEQHHIVEYILKLLQYIDDL